MVGSILISIRFLYLIEKKNNIYEKITSRYEMKVGTIVVETSTIDNTDPVKEIFVR